MALLGLVAALQAKHLLFDFFLQTGAMLADKRRYGAPGGLLHVALHGLGTLVALLVLAPTALGLAVLIALVEMAVHYHIDWGKEQLNRARGYTPADPGFWVLIGLDQALHHWTYLVIAAFVFAGL